MAKAIVKVKDFTVLGATLPTGLQKRPDVWLTRFRNIRICQSVLGVTTDLVWAFTWLVSTKSLYFTAQADTLQHPSNPMLDYSMADVQKKHVIFFALALTAASISAVVGVGGAILHEKLPFKKGAAWGLVASDVALITGLSTIYYFSTAFYAMTLQSFSQALCGAESMLLMLGCLTLYNMVVTLLGAALPATLEKKAKGGGGGSGGMDVEIGAGLGGDAGMGKNGGMAGKMKGKTVKVVQRDEA